MKKTKGLIRNRFDQFQQVKIQKTRKQHRFKYIGKEEPSSTIKENEEYSSSLLSTNLSQPDIENGSPLKVLYESITSRLNRVDEIKKQMNNFSKSRLKSFKEEITKDLDRKIGALAVQATENIIEAQKQFQQLKNTNPNSQQQQKFIKNIVRSLGSQIREATKTLRYQEKEYFDKIKIYEEGSHNKQVQLTETQRNKMKDWEEDQQILEEIDKQRDEQINKLVASINGLTRIYKQMADLVLEQGTMIDRIDYNIDKAMDHTEKGVQHLKQAEKRQESPFANNCIKVLVGIIIVFAIILGFKYGKAGG